MKHLVPFAVATLLALADGLAPSGGLGTGDDLARLFQVTIEAIQFLADVGLGRKGGGFQHDAVFQARRIGGQFGHAARRLGFVFEGDDVPGVLLRQQGVQQRGPLGQPSVALRSALSCVVPTWAVAVRCSCDGRVFLSASATLNVPNELLMGVRRKEKVTTLRYTLPWMLADLEEIDEVFGGDPWPYGTEPNRPSIEALLQYTHEQGLTGRRIKLEELFAPSTLRDIPLSEGQRV